MTLKEFNSVMQLAHHINETGKSMQLKAAKLEDEVLKAANIDRVDREPGFPSWRITGLNGWFNTPQEAAEAKEAGST